MIANHLYHLYLAACNLLLRLPGHRLRRLILRHIVRADIDPTCSVERAVAITSKGGLRIGAWTNVNTGAVLDARGGLRIGSRVNLSPGVVILTADHDPQSPDFVGRSRPTEIGDRAWIAYGAMVLPGVRIGEGAIVAAGSVVTRSVEDWTIVGGNPARVIGARDRGAQHTLEPYRRPWH
jgi:maltose O-acetyltransferase